MALTFNPLDAARKLRANGMEEATANATVEVVTDAIGSLVTADHLDMRLAEQRAEFFRALWIQGAGIVTVNAAIVAAAFTLAQAFD
ncbi:MAG: hypothetical protein OXG61_08125 [Chloroflexi bacterium]|nr:hypothetical protein [Chloroflexota bacterium]